MSGRFLHCPICGSPMEDQTWAGRLWVDCPGMHRLGVSPGIWEDLCRKELIGEIREFLGGMPPIPEDVDEG